MVGVVARLCIVLSCLSLAALGSGCSSGSQFAKCVPDASVACACPTGQQGAQACNSAGTFAAQFRKLFAGLGLHYANERGKAPASEPV